MKTVPEWESIDYLQTGNGIQRQAYETLTESNIFSILHGFTPILAGTIPLGINVPDSDLDIICYATDMDEFGTIVREHFGANPSFTEIKKENYYTANFIFSSFEFEIFAEPILVKSQFAYRHMVIEHRILENSPDSFRKRIMELKNNGLKTEPAFARLLHIEEPYSGLLELEKLSDEELMYFITERFR